MLDRRFAKPFLDTELKKPSVLALWLFPMQAPLLPISKSEQEWAKSLPPRRSKQYHHSRGYTRYALAALWKVPALEIPLESAPSKPPKLPNHWGFLSFSHCCDALIVGWAPERIGVDLERADRSFEANKLFSINPVKSLRNLLYFSIYF